MSLKIGDTLYRFDGNRRHYTDPSPGRQWGEIIYDKHFEPLKIIGENKVSWILERGWKCSKKDLSSAKAFQFAGRGFFTAEGMADDIWQNKHRHEIRQLFERATAAELREIARILGYVTPTNSTSDNGSGA